MNKLLPFLLGCLLTVVFVIIINASKTDKTKTLILPEEICQASKGDPMQYYERNDTVFLEFKIARQLILSPPTQGQQVIVGEDLDYKQDDFVSLDTLKQIDSLVDKVQTMLKKK